MSINYKIKKKVNQTIYAIFYIKLKRKKPSKNLALLGNINITSNSIEIQLLEKNENISSDIKNKISEISNLDIIISYHSSEQQPSFVQQGKNDSIAKNIIAVASGKGGVGKSTIAFNLAVELAKSFNQMIINPGF